MIVKMLALMFVLFSFSTPLFAAMSEEETTANVVSEEVPLIVPTKLEFHFGADVVPFTFMDAETQPAGFATTDEAGERLEPFVQLKYQRLAFEFSQSDNSRVRETKYHGASLGKLEIYTPIKLIAKVFPVDKPDHSVSVGIGAEYTTVEGMISMGGFKFDTSYAHWTSVFQVSAYYHLNQQLTLRLNYEIHDIRIRTTIPYTTDLDSKTYQSLSFGILMRVFEK